MMRIAIVNDMGMAVEVLRRVVTSVPSYEVAWIARDGEQAVRMCAADVPDLILMDLIMPRMDGAEACRHIMRDSPCAILVVTATVDGNSSKVFDAMGWGALDAVNTPVLGLSGEASGASDLLEKIAMLGTLLGKGRRRADSARTDPAPKTPGASTGFPLIAIGASTGGPAALVQVLGKLPPDLRAAITIVQHVDEHFAPGMAEWLTTQTSRQVRIIRPNDRLDASVAQIASTNDHLILNSDLAFRYTKDPEDLPYRPSIDVFFRTVAGCWRGPGVGVLLTGMGTDGAQGLLALRQAGWFTIAQDQSTSVVYGMPKAAAKIDAAVEILPINEISASIARALSRTQPAERSRL
jgi:two-component system, chemotaxis family, response regulator WspF